LKVIEIVGNQYLRILALEETIGRLELEKSLLQEKVMKLTPQVSHVVGQHVHTTGASSFNTDVADHASRGGTGDG
jgi:hypothetical protein